MLQLFYSATVVEMIPVAKTNIEFYEIAHFLSKTTSFYKNYPPFIKKLQMASREKTQTSHITLCKKTQFLEIIETPALVRFGPALCIIYS